VLEKIKSSGKQTIGADGTAYAPKGRRQRSLKSTLRFSVALCTFNGEAYLEEQLASILAQGRPPDDVVICDDGSVDRTVDILRNFAKSAGFQVRIEVNPTRLGFTKNFEKAIQLCEGDVIALSDQDDCWYPTRLAMLEKAFLEHPSQALIFSDADLMDEGSRLVGKRYWSTCGLNERHRKQVKEGRALQVLLKHNVVCGATVAFRSELREIVLPIPEITVHDLWIAVVASVVSEIGMLPAPSIKYRKHSAQQLGTLNYSFKEALAKSKQIGAPEYLSIASQYAALRDRIREHYSSPQFDQEVLLLERKICLMERRAALPSQRWRRLPEILRDTVNLDYFRFAEGYKSIAKDLIR
jgi:hypothetical protein